MSRLQELLELYERTTAEAEAKREADDQARRDAEHARLLAYNVRLRELGVQLLGDLFTELAPAEPEPQEWVPLRLGPGPDHFLCFRMHFFNGQGDLPALVVDPGPRGSDLHYRLPASDERIAEAVAFAVDYRKRRLASEWNQIENGHQYDDWGDDTLREKVAEFQARWPEPAVIEKTKGWLDTALAASAERRAEQAARESAPTDAERALTLVRELVELVHLRE